MYAGVAVSSAGIASGIVGDAETAQFVNVSTASHLVPPDTDVVFIAAASMILAYHAASDVTFVLCGSGSLGYVNGHCRDAVFSSVTDVVVYGNALLVSDTGNNAIRRIDLMTGVVSTLVGSVSGASGWQDSTAASMTAFSSALFAQPHFLALVNDTLYVSQSGSHPALRIVSLLSGQVATLAGSRTSSSPEPDDSCEFSTLSGPSFVAVDPATGSVFVCDGPSSGTASSSVILQLSTTVDMFPPPQPVVPGSSSVSLRVWKRTEWTDGLMVCCDDLFYRNVPCV
jgi:hypothetical protein